MQEFYYAKPPQIERGRRHYLMSTAGRTYLDMVNNVTVLGHAHPRIADTAARQLRKLNTNSRFNYAAVVEFSERLAAHAARSAGHGLSGQLRLGGKRSGDPARDGSDGPARCGRGPRGLSRLDIRHGRSVDIDRRQPQCACHPTGLGAHGRIAQQLPRQVPRRRGRSVRRRSGGADRRAGGRRAPTRGVHLRERVRQCGWHGAAGRLPAAGVCGGAGGRRAGDLRRGSGRVWPSRRMVLGFHAAERGARHRRRSPSRRATGIRSAR